MTDAAPERITAGVSWGEQYFDPSAPDMPETEYVRADIAQARIAELEAALKAKTGQLEGAANWLDVLLTTIDETSCEPDDPDEFEETIMAASLQLLAARRALEAKP